MSNSNEFADRLNRISDLHQTDGVTIFNGCSRKQAKEISPKAITMFSSLVILCGFGFLIAMNLNHFPTLQTGVDAITASLFSNEVEPEPTQSAAIEEASPETTQELAVVSKTASAQKTAPLFKNTTSAKTVSVPSPNGN